MNRRLMEMAEKYIIQRKRRMQLLRAVTAMALVVAICTSYVLILPGLTLAAEVYCGQEEHVHTADCYVDTLSCLIEPREATTVVTEVANCSFVPHQHTADCRNAAGELCCGYWDKYIHVHDEMCYDNSGALICTLKETPMHNHNDGCYTWVDALVCGLEENAGHAHGESCYTRTAEPTCGLEESVGHHHDENCTVVTKNLTCDKPTTETDTPHNHADECYEVVTTYTCGLTEGEGAHAHTLDCYPLSTEPTCGLNEGDGAHAHTEECYAKVRDELTCTKYPEKVHTHSAACVDQTTGYYTCGYVEVLKHQHTQDCVKTVVAEDAGHQHTTPCYTTTCVCEIPEHIHNDDCFIEKTEGEETAEPTPEVTPEATIAPTEEVTEEPTAEPTVEVTEEPTAEPTVEVTEEPTVEPTVEVTEEPTAEPTVEVTVEPTAEPTVEVTVEPTVEPTAEVTEEPTAEPTPEVTEEPTAEPTVEVTEEPTAEPTVEVTEEPTVEPTVEPTPEVTEEPTAEPTVEVTEEPTVEPTVEVMAELTAEPTPEVTEEPTAEPTVQPTATPEGTDYTEEEWEYINAILNGTAPEGMGDIGFLGLDDPGNPKPEIKVTELTFDAESDAFNEYAKQYEYILKGKIDVPQEIIPNYTSKENAFTIETDGFDYRQIGDGIIYGKDEQYAKDKTAFYIACDQDNNLKIWFDSDYIQHIKNTGASGTAYGNFTMSGKLTAEDLANSDKGETTIKFGSASTTIKREDFQDGGQSVTNQINIGKSVNDSDVDWKEGKIAYTATISTPTGTGNNSITLKDTMLATSNNQLLKLNGFGIDSIVEQRSNTVYEPVLASGTEVKTDGTCTCGTNGNHVHYQIITNEQGKQEVVYAVPPLAQNAELKIKYTYTLDKSAWNETNVQYQKWSTDFNNTLNMTSGAEGSWDETSKTTTINKKLTSKKIEKTGRHTENGKIDWSLTINQNYLNIAGEQLKDNLLSEIVDAEGNLNLTPSTDGKTGFVSGITVTPTTGDSFTLDASNINKYIEVVQENSQYALKFTEQAANSQFSINYSTFVAQAAQNTSVSNTAEFDGEKSDKEVTVPASDKIGVSKKSTSNANNLTKGDAEDTYVLNWESEYVFATGETKYKLKFGDQLNINVYNHYFTKAQMDAILDGLLQSDLVETHLEQNVKFTLNVYRYADNLGYIIDDPITLTYDANQKSWNWPVLKYWENNVEKAYDWNQRKYGKFEFVTDTNSDGVKLTTNTEEGEYKLNLNYSSTAQIPDKHAENINYQNHAYNAEKTVDATFTAPGNLKITKEYSGEAQNKKNPITSLDAPVKWTIKVYSSGQNHTSINLTENLPKGLKFESVTIKPAISLNGWSADTIKWNNDQTQLVLEKQSGTDGEYMLSWDLPNLKFKADIQTTEAGGQTLNIGVLPNKNAAANTNNDGKFFTGESQYIQFEVTCKIDPDMCKDLENLSGVKYENGTYEFDTMTNSASVKFDGEDTLYSESDSVDLTYTDQKKVRKELTKTNVIETAGNYNKTIKYRIEINAGMLDLLEGSDKSQLQLTDVLEYAQLSAGWIQDANHADGCENGAIPHGYYRTVTINPTSIKMYNALTDGKQAILDKDGKLQSSGTLNTEWALLSKEEKDSSNNNLNANTSNWAKPFNENKDYPGKQIVMTFAIPNKTALILEYECKVELSVPVGAAYTLTQIANRDSNAPTIGVKNTATLLGSKTFQQSNDVSSKKSEYANSGLLTYGLVITKVDKDAVNVSLPNTEYTLYKWDKQKNQFEEAGKKYTDEDGRLNFNYTSQSADLEPNTAYFLVETKAADPYILQEENRPIIVMHVQADGVANESYPNGWTKKTFADVQPSELKQYIDAVVPNYASINGVYTITGSNTIELQLQNSRNRRDLSVTKEWSDESGNTQNPIEVTLRRYAVPEKEYQDAKNVNNQFPVFGPGVNYPSQAISDAQWNIFKKYPDSSFSKTATLSKETNWKVDWADLESDGVDADGNKIIYVYYVEEKLIENYVPTYQYNDFLNGTTTQIEIKITNTKKTTTLAKTDLHLTKEWIGFTEDEIANKQVHVTLERQEWKLNQSYNGWGVVYQWTKTGNPQKVAEATLSKATGWQYTFENLILYQVAEETIYNMTSRSGTAYTYTIKENGDDVNYKVEADLVTDASDYFENDKYTPKTPSGESGIAPAAETKTTTQATLTNFKSGIVIEKKWEDGIEAGNTAHPQAVDIYLKRYAVPEADYNKLQFAGNYAMLDEAKWAILRNSNWQDTSYSHEIALSSTLNWQAGVYGLEATGKDASGNTVYYIYYVEEEMKYDRPIPGGKNHVYTPSYVYQGSISNGTGKITITVTNTLQEVRKMSFNFQKNWENVPDNKKPESLTVYLMQQEWSYNATDNTWSKVGEPVRKETVAVTASGGWQHSFSDLLTVELSKTDGPFKNPTTIRAFTYTVVEAADNGFIATTNSQLPETPAGYFEENSETILNQWGQVANYVDPTFTGPAAITITNTLPDTFDLEVYKNWCYLGNGNYPQYITWPEPMESTTVEITVTQVGYIDGDKQIPFAEENQVSTKEIKYDPLTPAPFEAKATFNKLPKKVKIGETWYQCYYQITEVVKVDGEPVDTWTAKFTDPDREGNNLISVDGVFNAPANRDDISVILRNERPMEFNLQVNKVWQNTDNNRLQKWPNDVEVTFTLTREKQNEQSEWVTDATFSKTLTGPGQSSQDVTFEGLPMKWKGTDGLYHNYRYKLEESTTGLTIPCQVTINGLENGCLTLPDNLGNGDRVQVKVTNTIPDTFGFALQKSWTQNGITREWPRDVVVEFALTCEYKQTTETGEEQWTELTEYSQTIRLEIQKQNTTIANLPKKVLKNGNWVDCRYRLKETTTSSNGVGWTVEYAKEYWDENANKSVTESLQVVDGSIIVPDNLKYITVQANNVLPVFSFTLEKEWRRNNTTVVWPVESLEFRVYQQIPTGDNAEGWTDYPNPETPYKVLTLTKDKRSDTIAGLPKQVMVNGMLVNCRYRLEEVKPESANSLRWTLSYSTETDAENLLDTTNGYLNPNQTDADSITVKATNTLPDTFKFYLGKWWKQNDNTIEQWPLDSVQFELIREYKTVVDGVETWKKDDSYKETLTLTENRPSMQSADLPKQLMVNDELLDCRYKLKELTTSTPNGVKWQTEYKSVLDGIVTTYDVDEDGYIIISNKQSITLNAINTLPDTFDLSLKKIWRKWSSETNQTDWPNGLEEITLTLTQEYNVKDSETDADNWQASSEQIFAPRPITINKKDTDAQTVTGLPKQVYVNGSWYECRYRLVENPVDGLKTDNWGTIFKATGVAVTEDGIVDPTYSANENVVTVWNVLPDTFDFTLTKSWPQEGGTSYWPSAITSVEFALTRQYNSKENEQAEDKWVNDTKFGTMTATVSRDENSEFIGTHKFTNLAFNVFVDGEWRECRYVLKEVTPSGTEGIFWKQGFECSYDFKKYVTIDEDGNAVITPDIYLVYNNHLTYELYAKNTLPDVFSLNLKKQWQNKAGSSVNWPNCLDQITLTLTQEYNANTGENGNEDWQQNDSFGTKTITIRKDGPDWTNIENLPKQVYIGGKLYDCRYRLTEEEHLGENGTYWKLEGASNPIIQIVHAQNNQLVLNPEEETGASVTLSNDIQQYFGKISLDVTKEWSGVSRIPNSIELRFPYQRAKYSTQYGWRIEPNTQVEYDTLVLEKDKQWQNTLTADICFITYDGNQPMSTSYLKIYTGEVLEYDTEGHVLSEFTSSYTLPTKMPTAIEDYVQNTDYWYLSDNFLYYCTLEKHTGTSETDPSYYYYLLSLTKPTAEGETDNSLTITNYPTLDLTITKDWQIGTGVLPDGLEVKMQVQRYSKRVQYPNDAWGRDANGDQTIVLDATNKWSCELKDLPRYSANAEFQYTYAVRESEVRIGEKVIENAFYLEYQSDATDTSATVNVTNIPKVKLSLKKEWKGDAPENTYVYINLKREVRTAMDTWELDKNYSQIKTLPDDENGWQTDEFYLEVYDSQSENPWKNTDGSLRQYRYYIQEQAVANYFATSYTVSGTDVLGNLWTLTKGTGDWAGWYCFDPLDLRKDESNTTNTSGTATVTITNTPDQFAITKKWNSTFQGDVLEMYLYLEYMEDVTGDNVTYQPVITETTVATAPKVSFTDVRGQTQSILNESNSIDYELEKKNGKWYIHIKRQVTQAPTNNDPIEWKITFSGLPKNAMYRVTELEGMGYTVAYSNSNNGLLVDVGDTSGNAAITNTPTSIKVEKQFVSVDDDDKPINMPQTKLYFGIMRQKYDINGEPLSSESASVPYTDFNAAQLKATAKNTTVSVDENSVICLDTTLAGTLTSAGFELSYLPKYWYDANTQERGLWKYTVYEQDAEGEPVHATVSDSVNPDTSITADNTITVTNVVTDIDVTKVWLAVDGNTLNPANLPDITLTLMQSKFNAPLSVAEAHRDDVEIGKVTLSYDEQAGVVAKLENNGTAIGTVGQQTQPEGIKNLYWSYKWSNLPAYQETGESYYYYVKETNPGAGWTQATGETANTQNPIAGDTTSNRTFQITNEAIRYTLPETGGMGTLPYTAGGLLLMAAAAFLLGQQVKHRREDC